MSKMDDANDVMSKLPVMRWRVFEIRYDLPMSELTQSQAVMLVIMAHEYWRATETDGNKNDWARFEAMSLVEINEFLGMTAEAAPEDADSSEVEADEDATKRVPEPADI
jgi:hypothetical protein